MTIENQTLNAALLCRNRLAARPRLRQTPRRMTHAEAAALLVVSETTLLHWRVVRHGPTPVLSATGWAYDAATIERLAAIPKSHRLLAIARAKN